MYIGPSLLTFYCQESIWRLYVIIVSAPVQIIFFFWIFSSDRSSVNANVRPFVRLFDENLSRAHNHHLLPSDYLRASLKGSCSILRSLMDHSCSIPRASRAFFKWTLKDLWVWKWISKVSLVEYSIINNVNAMQCIGFDILVLHLCLT